MTIQYIINRAQQIEIDRRRVVGQTISRSQRIKTAERSTSQPYRFKITPPAQMPWSQARPYIEVIDLQDRVDEYEISLNGVSGMNYITAYQGDCNQTQLNNLTIQASGTSTITITNLPAIASFGANTATIISTSSVIFRKGDIIQPANSRYPYTVVENVLRTANTTTSITLHRPIITSENITITGQGLNVGNSATWAVVVAALPTYSLIPGQRVQYNGDFELIEKVI